MKLEITLNKLVINNNEKQKHLTSACFTQHNCDCRIMLYFTLSLLYTENSDFWVTTLNIFINYNHKLLNC